VHCQFKLVPIINPDEVYHINTHSNQCLCAPKVYAPNKQNAFPCFVSSSWCPSSTQTGCTTLTPTAVNAFDAHQKCMHLTSKWPFPCFVSSSWCPSSTQTESTHHGHYHINTPTVQAGAHHQPRRGVPRSLPYRHTGPEPEPLLRKTRPGVWMCAVGGYSHRVQSESCSVCVCVPVYLYVFACLCACLFICTQQQAVNERFRTSGSTALCGRLCGSVWQALWLCMAGSVALCGKSCGSLWQALWLCVTGSAALCGRLCVAGSVALCGRLCGSVWQVLWLFVVSSVTLCGRLCGS